ncbi:MAG: SMP-30/gluconolactonase/LRE family protein [Alphaproteobacteria bacterium]|nr:SMP-30/gluconolactonase/LRE family protein [Alphaproteobacteria bacterium]
MYPQPTVIEPTVFAEVPDELQLLDKDSHMSRDIFRGRPLGSFLEGPSFDRDGNLYVVDIAHSRVFKISPGGDFDVAADYDGRPNGLKIHKDGRIFVADRRKGIVEIDPVNGKVSVYIGPEQMPGYKGVNDLFFASNGDLYFTDQGDTGLHDPTGRVFRMDTNGTLHCLIDNVPSPNGLVMDPSESQLYIAVTRANAVWRMPFRQDGSINRVGLFCQLVGGMGPDGMAMDVDGNLSIAHAGFGAVWLFSALGLPMHKIPDPDGSLLTTNMAYGGPDNRSLFITSSFSGKILRAEMPCPGETMYAHMD